MHSTTGRYAESAVIGQMSRTAAIGQFLDAQLPMLWRTACALTRNRSQAEDLLQSALEKTITAWPNISGPPEFYVRKILHHQHVNSFRRRRILVEDPTADIPETDFVADPATRVVQQSAVADALATLPARQRRVVILRYLDDYDVATVATILGCSESTVRSQAHRALVTLRRTAPFLLELD